MVKFPGWIKYLLSYESVVGGGQQERSPANRGGNQIIKGLVFWAKELEVVNLTS